MRKKLTAAMLALAMLVSLMPAALAAPAEAMPTNDRLTVDGVAQNPTVYKIGGSNYFKIRDLAAILNGTSKQFGVGYDSATKSVTATTGQGYAKQDSDLAGPPAGGNKTAVPSNDTIYVDGAPIQAEVYKIDGSNYFKLRDLGDALGFAVDWSKEQGMMIDTSKTPTSTQPTQPATPLELMQGTWISDIITNPNDGSQMIEEWIITGNEILLIQQYLTKQDIAWFTGTFTIRTDFYDESVNFTFPYILDLVLTKYGTPKHPEMVTKKTPELTSRYIRNPQKDVADGNFAAGWGIYHRGDANAPNTPNAVVLALTAELNAGKELASKYPNYAECPGVPDFGAIYGIKAGKIS